MELSGTPYIEDFRIALESSWNEVILRGPDSKKVGFRIPFTRQEVELALNDYAPNRVTTDPLASFGSTLFSSLFSGELGQQFWRKLSEVESHNGVLRLRIVTNVERLQHLPWELLFDPSRGDFMSLSGRLTLVRTRPDGFGKGEALVEPLKELRILAAEADVSGVMQTSADLEMLNSLAAHHSPYVRLDVLQHATRESLRAHLRSASYDIFHYAGAGQVLKISSRGGVKQSLSLWSDAEGADSLDRNELGEMLERSGVRLALLNASHTDWVARTLAKYIPASLGFRENVEIQVCLAACRELYSNLFSRTPLDQSITAVRQSLDLARPGSGDWCKLIFFMQTGDGNILLNPNFRTDFALNVQDKGKMKSSRLLEVYQQNLAAAERSPKISAEQVKDLREKVDKLRRELS